MDLYDDRMLQREVTGLTEPTTQCGQDHWRTDNGNKDTNKMPYDTSTAYQRLEDCNEMHRTRL